MVYEVNPNKAVCKISVRGVLVDREEVRKVWTCFDDIEGSALMLKPEYATHGNDSCSGKMAPKEFTQSIKAQRASDAVLKLCSFLLYFHFKNILAVCM